MTGDMPDDDKRPPQPNSAGWLLRLLAFLVAVAVLIGVVWWAMRVLENEYVRPLISLSRDVTP